MSTYYEDLGVKPTATVAEIKKQYRSKALLVHPDAPTGSDAAFVRVSTAYECLSNALLRREYDAKLARAAVPVVTTSPTPSSRPVYASTTNSRAAAYNGTYSPRPVSIYQTPFGKFALLLGFVILILVARAVVSFVTSSTGTTTSIAPRSTSSSSATPTGIQNVDPTKNTATGGSTSDTPTTDTSTAPNPSTTPTPTPTTSTGTGTATDGLKVPSSPTSSNGSTSTNSGSGSTTIPSQPTQPVPPTQPTH